MAKPLQSTTQPAPAKLAPAPVMNAGDAIELAPLVGKAVAIFITDRVEKNTKFGLRQMSGAILVCEGEKEPLRGVLFQSYFQRLPIHEWLVGVVVKTEKAWGLDAAAVKPTSLAALEKLVAAVADEVPF